MEGFFSGDVTLFLIPSNEIFKTMLNSFNWLTRPGRVLDNEVGAQYVGGHQDEDQEDGVGAAQSWQL